MKHLPVCFTCPVSEKGLVRNRRKSSGSEGWEHFCTDAVIHSGHCASVDGEGVTCGHWVPDSEQHSADGHKFQGVTVLNRCTTTEHHWAGRDCTLLLVARRVGVSAVQ